MSVSVERELVQLGENAASNGISIRKKAAEKINLLLNDQIARDVISQKTAPEFDTQLFLDNLFKGLRLQIQKEGNNKWIQTFTSAIQKVLDIVILHPDITDAAFVVDKIISLLEDDTALTVCGSQSLDLLTKFLSGTDVALCSMKLLQWNELLTVLVNLCIENGSLSKLLILRSLNQILAVSISTSSIVQHLPALMRHFRQILMSADDELLRWEAISINYIVCEALAAEEHTIVVRHVRKILEKIIENYHVTNNKENREIIIKFFHLILILYDIKTPDQDEIALNSAKVKMYNILNAELKLLSTSSGGRNFSASPYLIKFGACLYTDLIRKKFISQSTRKSDEQARKRTKFNEEFNEIFELVSVSGQEFNYRWFCVLCEIVIEHRNLALTQDDIKGIMEILLDIQETLKIDSVWEYFCKCCSTLLVSVDRNPQLMNDFRTIGQRILKKLQFDQYSTVLVSKMIHLNIIPVEDQVRILTSSLTCLSANPSMEILMAALNNPQTKEQFFTKNPSNVVTRWINSSVDVVMKLPTEQIAKLLLIYVMNTIPMDFPWPQNVKTTSREVIIYVERMKEIVEDLKYQSLKKFMQRVEKDSRESIQDECQVSSVHLQELLDKLPILPNNIPTDVAALYYVKRSEIFLFIHNSLRKLCPAAAGDFLPRLREEVLKNMREMERYLKDRQLGRIHIPSVIQQLSSFLREDKHGVTRSYNISGVIKWLSDNTRLMLSHLNGSNAENYREIVNHALQCFVHLHTHHAEAVKASWKRITEEYLDDANQVKKKILLNTFRVIFTSEYSESLTEWSLGEIHGLAENFYRNQGMAEELIEVIYAGAACAGRTDDVEKFMRLSLRFIKHALKNHYRPQTVKILIQKIITLFRSGVANDEDSIDTFIEALMRFFKMPIYTIQLNVVEALVEIFGGHNQTAVFSHFPHEAIEEFFRSSGNSTNGNILSIHTQLFHGLFLTCQPARRTIFYKFTQSIGQNDFIEDILCRLHSGDFNEKANIFSQYVDYCMPDMMELWARGGNPIDRFPAKIISPSRTIDNGHMRNFAKNLLFYGQEGHLKDLTKITESFNMKQNTEEILRDCFTLILSNHNSNCRQLKEFFIRSGRIVEDFSQQNASLILEKLFENFWDSGEYEKFFGFSGDNETFHSELTLNCAQFSVCLDKLTQNAPDRTGDNILVSLCHRDPFAIVRILMKLKEAIHHAPDTEESLKPIFKFIFFSRKISTVLENDVVDGGVRNFFFCEIIRFLLNLVQEVPEKIAVPVLRELNEFITGNFSNALDGVKEQLDFTVDKLIKITTMAKNEDIKCLSLECLNFFFVTKQNHLADQLKVINIVPKGGDFHMIRESQGVLVNVSFNNCEILSQEPSMAVKSDLLSDIEHFLAIKNHNYHSIRHLHEHLARNVDKLALMYENLGGKDTILHKLTKILIELTLCDDDAVVEETTKCLSEMGYLETSPSCLAPKREDKNINYEMERLITYREISQQLLNLQQDPNVSVSNAASTALNLIVSDPIGNGMRMMKYRKVFLSPKRTSTILTINQNTVKSHISLKLFTTQVGDTHEQWLQRVAGKVLQAFDNTSLQEIVMRKPTFAEFLTPTLISLLLWMHYPTINGEIEKSINDFFTKYAEVKATKIPCIHLNKKSIEIMLNICDCIRFYNTVSYRTVQNAEIFHRINLNNLLVSDAACYCENYTTSLVYAEIWIAEQLYNEHKTTDELLATSIRENMIKCYEEIEDEYAAKPFYGLEQMRLSHLNFNQEYLVGQLTQYEMLMKKTKLKNTLEDLNDNCLSEMGKWTSLDSPEDFSLESNTYNALKNLHKGDRNITQFYVEKARKNLTDLLRKKNQQASKIFSNHFTMMKQIQQIDDFCQAFFLDGNQDNLRGLYEKWQWHDSLPCTTFSDKEKILAQRLAILDCANNGNLIKQKHITLLKIAQEARESGSDGIAKKYLKHLQTLSVDTEIEAKMLLEHAQLCISSGNTDLAKKIFASLKNDSKYSGQFTRITGLWTCGEFFSDNMIESPSVIYKEYFVKAIEELDRCKDEKGTSSEKVKIYTALARFADKVHTDREKYLKSMEYKEKCHWLNLNEMEIEKLKNSQCKSSNAEDVERRMKMYLLQKNSNLDKQEIENIQNERNQYLSVALKYYLSLEIYGDTDDVPISRIVSLWCANPADAKVTSLLEQYLNQVPSYKFLKILPQLASRLGHTDPLFTKLLARVLLRCCGDHPYHTINHIMALSNANYDSQSQETSIDENSKRLQRNAKDIIDKLREKSKTRKIVAQFDEINIALIDLANRKVNRAEAIQQGGCVFKFGKSEKLLKIKNLELFHLPIVYLPVRKDCNYVTLIYVKEWMKEFELLSGVNAPKRLFCQCSDGIVRSLIVKGNDDLRQDALMQQVFVYINDIFRKKAHLQKLQMRTYKIIPLSKRSGYMEFCENSIPLTTYLNKAHKYYHPQEMSFADCRRYIQEYAQDSPSLKLEKYLKLCKKVTPVFYNYFLEQFSNPHEWFQKRLTYIHTVASTSMVGFILGIGDRHLSNILLDQKTAQIIHIDFGISFERGLIQNTPELVPFRLTRDIVSAMGFLGVDGIFRRLCEVTMEVLRENQSTINTILDVLLYDPLCNWSTSPLPETARGTSANSVASNELSGEEKNASAARALLRVNEKLSGRDCNVSVHSVSTQVERLIQQAMNPANLSRMFYGWCAIY